jgi:hypothetical protein
MCARALLGREMRQSMSDRPPGCVGWVGRQGTGQSSRSACLGPTYAPADQSPGGGSEENGTPKQHARARSRLPRGLRPRRARAHAGRQKRRVRRGRGRRPAAAAPSVWTWCRFGMLTDASAPRGPSTGGCAQDNVPVLVNPTRVISSNGEDDQKCPAQREHARARATHWRRRDGRT